MPSQAAKKAGATAEQLKARAGTAAQGAVAARLSSPPKTPWASMPRRRPPAFWPRPPTMPARDSSALQEDR